MRYCGARGQLTVRADSGFYTHAVVAVCRRMDVRFSIAIRQRARLRNLIEAIPEDAWTPIPYWMDGAADVAETTYTPFQAEADAAPVRLIVRRVKPAPGSQLALFATYNYHGFITDRDGETLELEADHRRHAQIENAIRDLKYGVGLNHLPSGRFAANGAWLAVQVMAHNLARWTARWAMASTAALTSGCFFEIDLLDSRGLGPLPDLPDLPYLQMLLGLVGFLGWVSLLVLLSPTQLSTPARAFAKTFLIIGAALVITILVDVLIQGKEIDSELAFTGGLILAIATGLLGAGAATATVLILAPKVSEATRFIAKIGLALGAAVLTSVFAAALTGNSQVGGGPANLGGATVAEGEVQEQLVTAESQVTGRGLSFRTDIWKASAKLVIDRPWFEYEGLSNEYLRPLVGYGPEMFKYTFPLESPLGGLLSHAHNFILHHFVEQGVLGLFSSLGLS